MNIGRPADSEKPEQRRSLNSFKTSFIASWIILFISSQWNHGETFFTCPVRKKNGSAKKNKIFENDELIFQYDGWKNDEMRIKFTYV